MAYTYLTLGSWERDIGTCNALTVLRGKQKRKIFSFSFSPANRFSFYSLLTKHTCTCTYLCLCCLFAEGRDIPTLATTAGTKNEIHSCICHARLVPICVKQILPSRTSAWLFSPDKPLHTRFRFYSKAALGVSYCLPLIVNKSLGHTSPIGPLLVSCLIHCRSPTPSAILLRLTELRSSSVWRSSSA